MNFVFRFFQQFKFQFKTDKTTNTDKCKYKQSGYARKHLQLKI